MLEALGIPLALSPVAAARCLTVAGICFLIAPNVHAGLRQASPVRCSLDVSTVINYITPLVNPARPRAACVGCSNADVAPVLAKVLAARHCPALPEDTAGRSSPGPFPPVGLILSGPAAKGRRTPCSAAARCGVDPLCLARRYAPGELYVSGDAEQFGAVGVAGETCDDAMMDHLAVGDLVQAGEQVHVQLVLGGERWSALCLACWKSGLSMNTRVGSKPML